MSSDDKPLVWLHGEIKSPPLSRAARVEAGVLLRRLQAGAALSLPHSRPMPIVGARCHELCIQDESQIWRIMYRVDSDAVLILEVFSKKTQQTPRSVIAACKRRLTAYDAIG
jgi:phage-related protein